MNTACIIIMFIFLAVMLRYAFVRIDNLEKELKKTGWFK